MAKRRRRRKTPQMTAEDARHFSQGHSTRQAMILDMAAAERGCNCEPYQDWFTYGRWRAQGQQVQQGEKGTNLAIYIETEKEDKETGEITRGKRPWHTRVFCRHQVAKREQKQAA